ncbi:N-acetylmuramic acid 6-phosphate etherase [Arthrobacter citreus]|nr:N-acetylmuramic acid 6-phosphate etherase [Arthrobacter citreus]
MDKNFSKLSTEQVNYKTINIDTASTTEILRMINEEDFFVPLAVRDQLENISKAVYGIVERIKIGGRLFYIGAGTSGRLGILDASECPPTYGIDPELIQGLIAGGSEAIHSAVEGAEDREDLGKEVIYENSINEKDVVVGITASGRTPYVISAVKEAKIVGALTIGISNNIQSQINEIVDIEITPQVGPEVIMGSTRMKSGTSQKLVLNMLTTATMVKLGKIYGNLMVDLQPTNKKLIDRTVRIVMHATGLEESDAQKYLEKSGFNPKVAIVMVQALVEREEAEELLLKADGVIKKAIALKTRVTPR